MKKGGLYLAVYDISRDKERNRMSSLLEGYGVRVQKSAFEVRLTKGQRQTLLRRVEALQIESGWVAFYRIDETASRHCAGTVPASPVAEPLHAYVL